MKYRKLPVEIEAYLWESNTEVSNYPSWVIEAFKQARLSLNKYTFTGEPELLVYTSTGYKTVDKGDYIIKDVDSEVYACNSDIFKITYEEV